MFEVGFSEIVLVFVIALVVLGPEKLPKLARRLGDWAGRARALTRQLQRQLDAEIDLTDSGVPPPRPAPPPPSTPPPPEARNPPSAASHE